MEEMEKAKIMLHADTALTKEQAVAINEAVAKIGPIQMAGMGLAMTMERTAEAIKDGLDKIEQAEKEFEEKLDPEREKTAWGAVQELKEQLGRMTLERNELEKMNDYHREEVIKGNQYREKLKETIVQLHERNNSKNEQISALIKEKDELEMELQRAKRVIDSLTVKKTIETNDNP